MKRLEPIFGIDDMYYCSVPVPVINAHKDPDYSFDFTAAQIAGYGQSQTHPSIVYIPEGWNGHKYWLATTPYPNALGVFENPCIYFGDEDENGNPPRVFTPISGTANGNYTVVNNPVVKVPSNTTTNSDPDLYFDPDGNNGNGVLYLYSRNNNTVPMRGFIQESIDGQSWTKRDNSLYMDMNGQPSVINLHGNILILGLTPAQSKYSPSDGYINGSSRAIFDIWKGTSMRVDSFERDGYACFTGKHSIGAYHADFFKDENTGKYYMIAACTNFGMPSPYDNSWKFQVYLAESEDGYNYYMFSRPLLANCTKVEGYYRPTAFVRPSDNMLIIYWCTIEYCSPNASLYPNGAADVPVDNRTIGLSYGNFADILYKLKEDNVTNIRD